MALFQNSIDFTDRDKAAILLRLQSLIRSVHPTWTDYNVANFGNVLLEAFAWVGDVLGYYQDNQARESFALTATQRRSLINLAKWLGYKPRTAAAATATVTFTLAHTMAGNVTIPAGTILSTKTITAPVRFQLLSPVTITAGLLSATGIVENSASQLDILSSSGLPNEAYLLSQSPYLDSSLSLTNALNAWAEAVDFLDATGASRVFVVSVDQNDKATFQVGDGTNGALLSAGTVTAAYKTGGGLAGNVDKDTITVFPNGSTFLDGFGTSVTVSATNALAASGGDDRENLEDIRKNAPAALRTQNRSVSRTDFETNAKRIAGVARVLALTANQEPGIAENSVTLFVVPTGLPGALPTQQLKDDVKAQFVQVSAHPAPAFPSTITVLVNVVDPLYLTVNVSAVVRFRAGAVKSKVAADIRAAIASQFALKDSTGADNSLVDFGFNYQDANGLPTGRIAWSDILDVVHDVTGVLRIEDSPDGLLLNGARKDLTIANRQFPILGTVSLIDGDTGSSL